MGARPELMLIDTCPLVQFFKNEAGAEKVEKLLQKAECGEQELAISALTLAELAYILSSYKDEKFSELVIKHVKASRIKIISVSAELAESGGFCKYKYSVPLADAIIAATAIDLKATLLSNDKHFRNVEGLSVLAVDEL